MDYVIAQGNGGFSLFEKLKSSIIRLPTCRASNIFIASPEFAKLFISQSSKTFSKQAGTFKSVNTVIGENVFSVSDEAVWRRHRMLLNPAFADNCMTVVYGTLTLHKPPSTTLLYLSLMRILSFHHTLFI